MEWKRENKPWSHGSLESILIVLIFQHGPYTFQILNRIHTGKYSKLFWDSMRGIINFNISKFSYSQQFQVKTRFHLLLVYIFQFQFIMEIFHVLFIYHNLEHVYFAFRKIHPCWQPFKSDLSMDPGTITLTFSIIVLDGPHSNKFIQNLQQTQIKLESTNLPIKEYIS